MGLRTTTPARPPFAVVALVAALALVAGACGPMEGRGFASDVERELDAGRSYATWLLARAGAEPTVPQAVAAGYLERQRLGLGSPFRLIEYALMDPRLEPRERERLAWSLLARTLDGDGHQLDARVLSPGGDLTAAAAHLELVEGAVRGSAAPDAGALAVRLAYAMAAAEGNIPTRHPRYVAQAAALIRDRVVARDDAARLLRAAGESMDPLALVTVWRVERRFGVERPSMLAAAQDVEREAIDLAPRLAEAVREIASRPRRGPVAQAALPQSGTILPLPAAQLLAWQAESYDAPPQTPVRVAMEAHRNSGSVPPEMVGEAARARFFAAAVNEERLAAEYALLHHRSTVDLGPRLAVLSAAVGLRGYAQERPWFPGFEGPSTRELESRFGLGSVAFPDEVPAHWRPYYRRMLAGALSDLQRILPSLDVRGLNVRFEARPGSVGTLAVHDPRTRTIYIPPATGAGTLAHEIAHDLDWQTALRRYAVRGDYATDRAVRLSDERLARVLRGLTTASLSAAETREHLRAHASRPAEVFARSVDWFVAVALARDGRLNGYLSSVQDDILTGYGTVTPPDVTGAAGQSLIALLDEVAPVYPSTRRWFLESYGRLRAFTAYDLARRVLETPLEGGEPVLEPDLATLLPGEVGTGEEPEDSARLPLPAMARLAAALASLEHLSEVRDSVVARADGTCRDIRYDERGASARRRLIGMVAEARARGIALDVAQELLGAPGRAWMGDLLAGRPGGTPPAPAAEALLPLADRARAIGATRVDTRPLGVQAPTADCADLPFPVG
ncbi:MAG TPA: hypothetical protein VMM12_08635 [Longimicrobiales bacterium]|nr:hypothetical protein [Longimicrobiales bacterium]